MTPMDHRTLKEGMEVFDADFLLGTGQTECFPSTNTFKPKWQLAKQGNYWGESALTLDTAVTAFVVVRKGETLTEPEILALCKDELGGFEVPKKVVFVQALPKTTTGKLQKNRVRQENMDLYAGG